MHELHKHGASVTNTGRKSILKLKLQKMEDAELVTPEVIFYIQVICKGEFIQYEKILCACVKGAVHAHM